MAHELESRKRRAFSFFGPIDTAKKGGAMEGVAIPRDDWPVLLFKEQRHISPVIAERPEPHRVDGRGVHATPGVASQNAEPLRYGQTLAALVHPGQGCISARNSLVVED